LFHVDARSDFEETEALGSEVEHGAFGNEHDGLPARDGVSAVERDLVDLVQEFLDLTFLCNDELAVSDLGFQPLAGERAAEDDLAGIFGDVQEAAAAGNLGTHLADVDVAELIALGEAEEGEIQTSAVIEVELVCLRDDGFHIGGAAEE